MHLLLDLHRQLHAQQKDVDSLKLSKVEVHLVRDLVPVQVELVASSRQTLPQLAEATGLDDLAEEVQARVARRVQQLPLLGPPTF